MTRRTRKLVGAALILGFVLLYGPLAMALAESRIQAAAPPVQAVAFLLLGLAWVLPLMPLIRWMERPDADEA